MADETSHDTALPKNKDGRPKVDSITLTKAARARFDTLAAESIEAVFQAVLTAATQDGDMAAAKLLIDRVIPSRRGAPVSFHIRPLRTPEDCALAYADLLDDLGAGRLTPDEAQTISAIVAKRRAVRLGRAGRRDRCNESAARRGRRHSAREIADSTPVRDHLTDGARRSGRKSRGYAAGAPRGASGTRNAAPPAAGSRSRCRTGSIPQA
jgi:hypothetical protein